MGLFDRFKKRVQEVAEEVDSEALTADADSQAGKAAIEVSKHIEEDWEEDIEEELERGNEHNKRIIIRNNQQREYESCIRDWDSSLPSQILDGDDLSSQIDELSSKISNIRSDIERVSNENMMAERHNTRLSIIQEQTEGFEKELEEIVAALGQVEEKATHLEILKNCLELKYRK